ncbi:MAG: lysine transporter LysE [Desulfuromonas sp.]|nr:MAG: lysine transporter LysE [Desulfuromonas sp.]
MNLAVIAGTSFVLGFSGAMMPGPLLTLTIAETVRRGAIAGPLLILGHAILEGIVVFLVFFGAAEIIQHPNVFASVAILGGGMMLWMGYGMLKSLSSLHLNLEAEKEAGLHPVVAGAVISLANPYFTIWWATIGLSYLVVAHEAGLVGVIVFYVCHILSDLVWYCFVSGTVAYGKRFLSDRGYRIMVGICAIFILGFGIYFGGKGLERLFLG